MKKRFYAGGMALLAMPFLLATVSTDAIARGKLCKADHYHSWSGSGRTKRQAQREALSGWYSYTSFEYGDAWARFRMAGNRSLRCSRSSSGWTCTATGRPCRRD